MSTSITLPKHRLEWVDCLRGIAAFLVVILHLWLSIKMIFHTQAEGVVKILESLVFGYTDFGKIGVVAFFLISGYVIPYSFKGKTNTQFFFNRFFRLYPAYWVSILSLIIVSGMPPVKDLLVNLTMLQRFVGVNDLIGAFWTLQIELVFYGICALLHFFKVLDNDKVVVRVLYFFVLLSVVCAVARYLLDKKLPVALFLALTVMFFGLCWRRATLEKSLYITKALALKILTGFIVLLLPITILAYSKNYGFDEVWYRYFLSYLVAIALFLVFSYYKFVNKVLLYLGSISYSLYLLHGVYGLNLTFKVTSMLNTNNIYLYIFIFFFLSFSSASLCYFLIEKPFVKIGRQLLKKVF